MMRLSVVLGCILLVLQICVPASQGQRGSSRRWGEWGEYGPCSVTCGRGKRDRYRTCLARRCRGSSMSTTVCQLPGCEEEYTKWSKFGECSEKCGGGIHSRTRTCLAFRCTGHLEEIDNCRIKECPAKNCDDLSSLCALWKRKECRSVPQMQDLCPRKCRTCKVDESWTEYGPCSVSCGAGLKTRTRGSTEQSITCVMDECAEDSPPVWGPWTLTESCSVTCGGGTEIRSRTCSQPGACSGDAEVTLQCNAHKCEEYSEWSKFGKCSVGCGGGIRSRTRECLVESCTGLLEEISNCKTTICKKDRCEDSASSSACQTAKAACSDKRIRKRCRKTCDACKEVPSWSEYGPCSVTCGVGLKTRYKESVPQSITCIMDECPEDTADTEPKWGPWTEGPCPVTCGGGIATRTRSCSVPGECTGPYEEDTECATEPCPEWNDWSDWSDCSTTCGPGTMTRGRECSVPDECEGDEIEVEECLEEDCLIAEWSDWSDWSECSATCGPGEMSRDRACSIPNECDGDDTEFEDCDDEDCEVPEWGEWSDWGPCSKTCGEGESARSRECSVPAGCIGDSEETEKCTVKPCEDSKWSTCSKSCGGGTRRRYYCNGTKCEWQFEGCAGGDCPEASCDAFGFLTNRYNSSHECCPKNHIPVGDGCGQQIAENLTDGSERRIIGGVDAVADQWPWMVAVYMAGEGFCAGSLISKKFVLSAAHCFAFDSGQPRNVSKWRIFAGILKLAQFRLDLGLKIKETYIHPDYTYPIADIALVELEEEVTFNPAIQPICLPHGEVTPEEATCFVTGWGVSTVPDTVTNHLQELGISYFDPRVCVHAYGQHTALESNVPFLQKNKGYICAGSLTKKIDSCSGDSGGPLVCQRCNSCSWYITGIVSFGPNPCALIGVPGVYTKVVYYEDWIFSVTKMKRHSLSCSSR